MIVFACFEVMMWLFTLWYSVRKHVCPGTFPELWLICLPPCRTELVKL